MERARNVVNVSPAMAAAPSHTMATTMAGVDEPATSTSGNVPCAPEAIAETCDRIDAELHAACDAPTPGGCVQQALCDVDTAAGALSGLGAGQEQDGISEAAGTMARAPRRSGRHAIRAASTV